jgi:hypothetical protein
MQIILLSIALLMPFSEKWNIAEFLSTAPLAGSFLSSALLIQWEKNDSEQ